MYSNIKMPKLKRKLKNLKNELAKLQSKIDKLQEKELRLEDTIYFTECEINQSFPDPNNFNLSYLVKSFVIQEVDKEKEDKDKEESENSDELTLLIQERETTTQKLEEIENAINRIENPLFYN